MRWHTGACALPYASANGEPATVMTSSCGANRSSENLPHPMRVPIATSASARSRPAPANEAVALPPPARPPATKHSAAALPAVDSSAR